MKKQCHKCNKTKPLSEFKNDPRYRLGVKSWCRMCTYAYDKEWSRKKSLQSKPICKLEGCQNKVPLGKSLYCSQEHYYSDNNKETWKRQKANPNYKEYHRRIAREWARKHRAKLRAAQN